MSGHIKQWHERIEGEMNGDSTFKAMKAEINELRAALVTVTKAPPASSNLLTAARHYASSYLQQERDYPRLCFDAQHHTDVCALFAAIEGEGEGGSSWISVEVRLPEENAEVAIIGPAYGDYKRGRYASIATFIGGQFYNEDGNDCHSPSHWTSLPKVPSAIAATKEGV